MHVTNKEMYRRYWNFITEKSNCNDNNITSNALISNPAVINLGELRVQTYVYGLRKVRKSYAFILLSHRREYYS